MGSMESGSIERTPRRRRLGAVGDERLDQKIEMKAARAIVGFRGWILVLMDFCWFVRCDLEEFEAHVSGFECFVEARLWFEVLVSLRVLCLCNQFFQYRPDWEVEMLHSLTCFKAETKKTRPMHQITRQAS